MDFAEIDIAALDNRLRDLQLKRWWVAEQIGVDRKTITRWLTGQTRRIHRDNLDRLASILECGPEELTANADAQVASEDQQTAAHLIEQENLLEILGPTGKWPLLEELIKSAMRPDLPKPLLGQLYNYLSIAAWRRSQLDKAEEYWRRAKQIGEETKFKSVLARARLNEATILSFRGKVAEALAAYEDCVTRREYFEDDMVYASALSNLGSVYHEYGDFERSLDFQDQAIAAFSELGKPMNLSIAWIGRGAVAVDAGHIDEAEAAIVEALKFAKLGRWERGLGDAQLVKSQWHAAKREAVMCRQAVDEALAIFARLGIDECRNHVCRAIALRLEEKWDAAEETLKHAASVNPDFPVALTEVLREWVRLAEDRDEHDLKLQKSKELGDLYQKLGCHGWLARQKNP